MGNRSDSNQNSDRNLLFGVFALQMDFLTRDQLVEGMQAWVLEKSQPLEEILIAKGFLAQADCDLLSPLIARHVEQHGGEASLSLQALSLVTPSVQVLWQVQDENLQQSLASLNLPAPLDLNAVPETVSVQVNHSHGIRYLSLRPHAKGGLGEVFVARDTELDREVALKEIQDRHAHDPNSRTRFVMEAEITGKLEHPGIVPVYGLGRYEDGRPFYAMRFIKGDSFQAAIHEFHEHRSSDQVYETVAFRKLLGRFVDVCHAVGYAHSRGVLHRDLKPGNVMLGKHGETLVVDWGLAKLKGRDAATTSEDATLQISSGSGTEETLPGSALGTPGYMSPEQAEGKHEQLGPTTDIYSLGAMLYTLLTGQRPIGDPDIGEILRRTVTGDFLSPRELEPHISKALEAICQKAMALSPSDRYATCEEFAEDVENFLAGEPVTAYPEPWRDRARRWIKNHRTLATSTTVAAGVAVLGLVIGLGVVTGLNQQLTEANEKEKSQRLLAEKSRQYANSQTILSKLNAFYAEEQTGQQILAKQEAERQRKLATKRLLQANQMASELVFTVDRKLAAIPAVSGVRRELLSRSEELLKSLLVDTTNESTTLRLRAIQLQARGDVAMSYEDLPAAETYYVESHNITRTLAELEPENGTAQIDHSISLCSLGRLAEEFGHVKDAQTKFEEALVNCRKHASKYSTDISFQNSYSMILVRLGDFYSKQGRCTTAKKSLKEALEVQRKLAQAEPENTEFKRSRSVCLILLGTIDIEQGHLQEAKDALEESFTLCRNLTEEDSTNAYLQRDLSVCQNNLAKLASLQGDSGAAKNWLEESLDICRTLEESDPSNAQAKLHLSVCLNKLGDLAQAQGDIKNAKSWLEESLTICRTLAKADPSNANVKRDLSLALISVGDLLEKQGDLIGAKAAFQEALTIARKLPGASSINTQAKHLLVTCLKKLGTLALLAGDFPKAKSLYDEALAISREISVANSNNFKFKLNLTYVLRLLGTLAWKSGKLPKAQVYFAESIRIQRDLIKSEPTNIENQQDLSISLVYLGDFSLMQNDLAEAQSAFTEALAIRRKLFVLTPNNPSAQSDLSEILNKLGTITKDKTLFEESRAIGRKIAKSAPGNSKALLNLSVSCYRLAEIANQAENWDVAIAAYMEALSVLDQVVARDQSNTFPVDLRADISKLLDLTKKSQSISMQIEAANNAPAIAEKPPR